MFQHPGRHNKMEQLSFNTCSVCNKENGVLYCRDCEHFLCHTCKPIHDIFPSNKRHTLTEASKEGRDAFKPKPVCESHKKDYQYYCNDCDCLICSDCTITVHSGHACCDYMNIVDQHRQSVIEIIDSIKAKVQISKESLYTIKTVTLPNIDIATDDFEKQVNVTVKELSCVIDKVTQIHKTTASDFQNTEIEKMTNFRENVEHVQNKYKNALLRLEHVLLEQHGVTFLYEHKSIQMDLDNLDEIQDIPTSEQIPNFNPESFTEQIIDELLTKFNARTIGCEEMGKPYSTERKSDSIVLQWKQVKPLSDKNYQIMYKEIPNGKWRLYVIPEPCDQPEIKISGLRSNTPYVFKVWTVDDTTGQHGPYSEESDAITTNKSPAIGLLQNERLIVKGPPDVYRLPIKEIITARNNSAKTRKFYLGNAESDLSERTLMFVGTKGSGKTTLINCIANYLMGVNWQDNFRFNLKGWDIEKEDDQAPSQEEWVTCYSFRNNVPDRVNYSVNIINTPGFEDTRGLENDQKIVEQIRKLFTSTGDQGVATLDAVCFILKAADARLTPFQRYIFESILSLFGIDFKDNICTLVTFADNQCPPVLAELEALDGRPLPYEQYFTFNNCALYADNSDNTPNNLGPLFWDMGRKSCERFFNHINTIETRSTYLSSEVLRKRAKLEAVELDLQDEIDMGLTKLGILENEIEIFTNNANAIEANKNFEFEVDEVFQEKIDLKGKDQYATLCSTCNFTCHECYRYVSGCDKSKCIAMPKDGKCLQCPNSCGWRDHHKVPFIIKISNRKVKKTYSDMYNKYEEAIKNARTQKQVLDEMNQDLFLKEERLHVMMEVIAKLKNRLKDIALCPDPPRTVQYASVKIEERNGIDSIIGDLHNFKQRANYGESVQIFHERLRNARQSMAARDVTKLLEIKKTPLDRIFQLFTK